MRTIKLEWISISDIRNALPLMIGIFCVLSAGFALDRPGITDTEYLSFYATLLVGVLMIGLNIIGEDIRDLRESLNNNTKLVKTK